MQNESQVNRTINSQTNLNRKVGTSTTKLNKTTNKSKENCKRKKHKALNDTFPSQKDLDNWLEKCVQDSTVLQISSSSEFLDNNSTNTYPSRRNMQKALDKLHYPNLWDRDIQIEIPFFERNSNKYSINTEFHHVPNDLSMEYTSLPPTLNFGDTNENNIIDNFGIGNSSKRLSEPCLIAPSDNESKLSEKQNSDNRDYDNQVNSNKFFSKILEKMNLLHETNSKICRNLHETKVEIEALKHAPNWGLRHRRDSLSGLSTQSQPLGYAFGTQSPAPTYHSGAYTPGMMTDVIREVKEAARVREDALLNRVKSIVEEKSWSLSEINIKLMKDLEQMKAQMQQLRIERKETNKKLMNLETENKYIKTMIVSLLNNKKSNILKENETFPSPTIEKISNESPRQKINTFNINYETINNNDTIKIKDRQKLNSLCHVENVYTMPESEHNNNSENNVQLNKDNFDFGQLQDALISKEESDNKNIALEKEIKRLQSKLSHLNNVGNIMNGRTSPKDMISNPSNLSHKASQIQNVTQKFSLSGLVTEL